MLRGRPFFFLPRGSLALPGEGAAAPAMLLAAAASSPWRSLASAPPAPGARWCLKLSLLLWQRSWSLATLFARAAPPLASFPSGASISFSSGSLTFCSTAFESLCRAARLSPLASFFPGAAEPRLLCMGTAALAGPLPALLLAFRGAQHFLSHQCLFLPQGITARSLTPLLPRKRRRSKTGGSPHHHHWQRSQFPWKIGRAHV